jgi:hypothetical protein
MHQLVYFSRNRIKGTDRDLLAGMREILKTSDYNNRRDGITGSLIFDKLWFLQILEGELDCVEATYRRIQADQRHGAVTLMSTRPIFQRQFPDWSMGGLMRTVDVQEVFLSHGIGGAIDPKKLSATDVVDLALDLKAHAELKRAEIQRAG